MSTTTTTTTTAQLASSLASTTLHARGSYTPLEQTGALAYIEQKDLTPVIGREFRGVQLFDLLEDKKADEKLRELAIIVSQRGVVFFKDQTRKLTDSEIKLLANKLGTLSGRPQESGLHIHPTECVPDPELSPITTGFTKRRPGTSLLASRGWHTDITFEPHPSDFAILQLWQLPENGGDTLWASAYEAYDRLTPAMQNFVEGLTAVNDGNGFHNRAKELGRPIHEGPRGHPVNVGNDLSTVHPVVRTNPVTGWKGLFVNNAFTKRIVELNLDESDLLLKYLFSIVDRNHDLQVRFKWDLNDTAVWSNAATFHTVTTDYEGLDVRKGNRTVSLGERPFLDPKSTGRREALGLPKWISE
ncbi:hypothetical protein JCM8547_005635 [Rhodosporidiobolus lusitaniae]